MKRSNVSVSILLPVLITLAVAMIALVLILGIRTAAAANDLSEQIITETVGRYALEFEAAGSVSYGVANALAPAVSSLAGETGGRESVIRLLTEAVETNNGIFGMWTAWEPNAFDGKDALYRNKQHHDSTGRFVPFVYKTETGVVIEPLAGYDDPVDGFYYQEPKKAGEPIATGPYADFTQSEEMLLYSIAIPIYLDGSFAGVLGVDIDMRKMNGKMNEGSIMNTGSLFTLSPGGLITTHKDSGLLLSRYEPAVPQELIPQFNAAFQRGGMFSAEAQSADAKDKVFCVAQAVKIGGIGGYWIVCGMVPMGTVGTYARQLVWLTAAAGLLLVVVIGFLIRYIVSKQLRGLSHVTRAAGQLATGDIDSIELKAAEEHWTDNEVELLSRAFFHMVEKSREQVAALQLIAQGDMTVETVPHSDRDRLNNALKHMVDSNRRFIGEIMNASGQVSAGARQISEASQMLAYSASEQAATVDELSALMEEIRLKSAESTVLCQKVAADVGRAGQLTVDSHANVKEMQKAMSHITGRSQTIQSIIGLIDDIAFQTNILALNASVEAARAGTQGKGFAVVATEVRDLATKSAEAANRIQVMIEESLHSIEEGNQIMESTNGSMEALNGIAEEIVSATALLEEAAAVENEMVASVTEGIVQLSTAIQASAANVEQTAASAEEMAAQSALLDKVVAQYKLNRRDGAAIQAEGMPPRQTQPLSN